MGFLNIFKKRVDEKTFTSHRFQMEALAFALMKFQESNGNYDIAEKNLKQINLDERQSHIIIDKLKKWHQAESRAGEFQLIVKDTQDLINNGQKQQAFDYVYQAYEKDSDNMQLLELLSEIALVFKSDNEILELYDQIGSINSSQKYNIQYTKGLFLKRIRKYKEAIDLFSELNSIEEFAWNYYQIAIIENLLGNTTSCLRFLEKAIEMNSEIKEDAKNYAELKNLHGDRKFISLLYN